MPTYELTLEDKRVFELRTDQPATDQQLYDLLLQHLEAEPAGAPPVPRLPLFPAYAPPLEEVGAPFVRTPRLAPETPAGLFPQRRPEVSETAVTPTLPSSTGRVPGMPGMVSPSTMPPPPPAVFAPQIPTVPPRVVAPEEGEPPPEVPTLHEQISGAIRRGATELAEGLTGVPQKAVRLGEQAFAGYQAGVAGLANTLANVPMILKGVSHTLSRVTGLPEGQVLTYSENLLRGVAQDLASNPEVVNSHQGFDEVLVKAAGQAIPGIAEVLVATAVGGPIAGFAGLGALSQADKGILEATKAAIKDAALGYFLRFTQGLPLPQRLPLTGGAFVGLTYAQTQDVVQSLAQGLVGAGLSWQGEVGGETLGYRLRHFWDVFRPDRIVPPGVDPAVWGRDALLFSLNDFKRGQRAEDVAAHLRTRFGVSPEVSTRLADNARGIYDDWIAGRFTTPTGEAPTPPAPGTAPQRAETRLLPPSRTLTTPPSTAPPLPPRPPLPTGLQAEVGVPSAPAAPVPATPTAAEEGAEVPATRPHTYSTTQATLAPAIAKTVRQAGQRLILPEDVHPTEGMEETPHITVKYGLETDAVAEVSPSLAGTAAFPVTVQSLDVFETEQEDYDVLVLRVDSPSLHTLHTQLSEAVQNTETFPEYKPHITLGYVKKGEGAKYRGRQTGLEGQTFQVNDIEFINRDDVHTVVPLQRATQPVAAPSPGGVPEAPAAPTPQHTIAVSFPRMPPPGTRARLKQDGFKWNAQQKVWEAPWSQQREDRARQQARLAKNNGTVELVPPTRRRGTEVQVPPPGPPVTPEAPGGIFPSEGVPIAEEPPDVSPTTRGIPQPARPVPFGEATLAAVPPEDVPAAPAERPAPPGPAERPRVDRTDTGTAGTTGRPVPTGEGGGDAGVGVAPERGGRARPRRATTRPATDTRPGNDYRITDPSLLIPGGPKARYALNTAAIRLLKQLETDGRLSTPDEQTILVQFTGWGAIPQVFDRRNEWDDRAPWRSEYQELKALLTPEEYEAARASTPNAHYTSLPIIHGIWQALERLGYRQGRVLEPAMGVGHFFGAMPAPLDQHSRRVGIELDPITGRIAKQLYQNVDVRVQGFQDAKLPDNFFDVAVSNVPFGDYKVHDPRYNRLRLPIHNYFFAKALDTVRPGGIVAFITSRYTLDAQSSQFRDYLAEHADLLGAIRFPQTAFVANAGTEVTTDVLFFQKRAPGTAAGGQVFQALGTAPGTDIPINAYFVAHPEMMLGTMQRVGTMYRAGEPALVAPEGQDMASALTGAVARLPENVLTPPVHTATTDVPVAVLLPAPGVVKPYGYTLEGGKIYQRIGDTLEPIGSIPPKTVQRIKGMIGVRDAARTLLSLEWQDAPEAEIAAARKVLNTRYDAFVRANGFVSGPGYANARAFTDDPDWPLLRSLERYDPETETATKADIFTKRTVRPYVPATTADAPESAMAIVLSETGHLAWERMAQLTGQPVPTLQEALQGRVFLNPEGSWETAEQYLSGNVRVKLASARAAAQVDPAFDRHVQALEAVQPVDIPAEEIDVRLGSGWVPENTVQAFVTELLQTRLGDVIIRYLEPLALWRVLPQPRFNRASVPNTERWGIPARGAVELIEDTLNFKVPTIFTETREGTRIVLKKETLAARQKQVEIQQEFRRWIWQDEARATRLAQAYNEQFNAVRLPTFDGAHLELPGLSPTFTPRPYQKDAVWRILTSGNVLLAHEVGAGKTASVVIGAMELRRLGLAKKPMIVVPNHLLGQWQSAFLQLYPAANILAAALEDFTPRKRQTLMNRIATGDWDAVIVPMTSFEKLPVRDETFNALLVEQITLLDQFIASEQAEGTRRRDPTVKELEKAKRRLESKLKERRKEETKDVTGLSFEELGVDYLLVDEAHWSKRLFFPSKMSRVAGLGTGESNRAFDLYVKSRHIMARNNGRGLVFTSGTPVTNTMAELFTLQRFLQPDLLRVQGLEHFDAWANAFGEIVQSEEIAATGKGYKTRSRFARFRNVPELLTMFRAVADVKLAEDLQLPKPELAGGKPTLIAVPASEDLKTYVEELLARAEAISSGRVSREDDNMLAVTGDGRHVALDVRLRVPLAPEPKITKVKAAVAQIVKIWREGAKDRLTQLVFLDLSTPAAVKPGEFNVYQDLLEKLTAVGIPRAEIAVIHEADTDAKKLKLFQDMNRGEKRILIGSTAKMGEGMNVQQRLVALHHLDAPWRPADIEQREGRILRPGNTNAEVQVFRYVTEESFDAYMWQTLETKARFIRQVMRAGTSLRIIEDVEDASLRNFAEAKAAASGDPRIFEKFEVDNQVQRLAMLKSSYVQSKARQEITLAQLPGRIETAQQTITDSQATQEQWEAFKAADTFRIRLGRRTLTDKEAAGTQLVAIAQETLGKRTEVVPLGNFAGFDLSVQGFGQLKDLDVPANFYVHRGTFTTAFEIGDSPAGAIQRLYNAVDRVSETLQRVQTNLTQMQRQQDDLAVEVTQPFADEERLQTSLARQQALNAELGVNQEVMQVGDDDAESAEAVQEEGPEYTPGVQERPIQPEVTYATRPDATADTQQLAEESLGDLEATRQRDVSSLHGRVARVGRPRGVFTLARGIPTDDIIDSLRTTGEAAFYGKRLVTPQDVAVAGQVVRDSRIERLFWLFRIGGETIAQVEVVSSRLPASSQPFALSDGPEKTQDEAIQAMARRVKALEARTGKSVDLILVHNHPSGNPQPSQGDQDLTARLAQFVPIAFHVVIDSGKYAIVHVKGSPGFPGPGTPLITNDVAIAVLPLPDMPGQDPFLIPAVPHTILGIPIRNGQDVALLGASLASPQDMVTLFMQSSTGLIRGVQQVPVEEFVTLDFPEYLLAQRRSFGSPRIFSYYTGTDFRMPEVAERLVRRGHLMDHMWAATEPTSLLQVHQDIPTYRPEVYGGGFRVEAPGTPYLPPPKGRNDTGKLLPGSPARSQRPSPVPFDDPAMEDFYQRNKGLRQVPIGEMIQTVLTTLAHRASREFEHLPTTARWAPLRNALLKLQKQRAVASDSTVRALQEIARPLNDAEFDLFSRTVILRDIREDLQRSQETQDTEELLRIPSGFTLENVGRNIAALEEVIARNPTVQEALDRRQRAWDTIKQDYRAAMGAIGFDVSERLSRESYFRHQVQDYAHLHGLFGAGKRLRTPTQRGFLKRRTAGFHTIEINRELVQVPAYDYNTEFLQAEFEVMAQMLYDIEIANTIQVVNAVYNIQPRLRMEALRANEANIMPLFEALAAERGVDDPAALQRQMLNQKIAQGIALLERLAFQGMLPDNGQYTDVVDALSTRYARKRDTDAEGPQTAPELFPRIFVYASWVLRHDANQTEGNEATRLAAATLFRGIREKTTTMKAMLGRDFLTWEDLIPAGYDTWQPREGNIFYMAHAIPEQIAEQALEQTLAQVTVNTADVRRALALGGKRRAYVLPTEVIDTVNALLTRPPTTLISQSVKAVTRGFKAWVMIGPTRFLRAQTRNMLGDAHITMIGNPHTFSKTPQAIAELWGVFRRNRPMSERMRPWFERGGMASVFNEQELQDLDRFRRVILRLARPQSGRPVGQRLATLALDPFRRAWGALRSTANFRESILRYAAYLDYLEQLEQGRGRPRNFGASVPQEIMGLPDNESKAYHLSNDLLGAYDRVGVLGQEVRSFWIPFWSFQELNLKRYKQLARNAAREGRFTTTLGRAVAGGLVKTSLSVSMRIGAFLLMATAFWLSTQLWNFLLFKDEEDELPISVRSRPHVIFGRNADGSIRYFSRMDTLGDVLEWIGLDAAPEAFDRWMKGRASIKTLAGEMAKAPINKLVNGVNPFVKLPAEILTRRQLFPDVFNPRMIRDTGLAVARTLGIEQAYRAVADLPTPGFINDVTDLLMYRIHPGEAAYHDVFTLRRQFLKAIGREREHYSFSPQGNALYNMKSALRMKDEEAAKHWLTEYLMRGGTSKGLGTSLRNMHPLVGMSKEEAVAFLNQLTPGETHIFVRALRYYTEILSTPQEPETRPRVPLRTEQPVQQAPQTPPSAPPVPAMGRQ